MPNHHICINVPTFIALAALLLICFSSAAQARTSYFVNHEVRYDTLNNFPKWSGVLARYITESARLKKQCGTARFSACKLTQWQNFLNGLKGKPLRKQVDEVNRFVNKYPYILDTDNWGVNDYWETPYEFQKHSGDCEDYAIAKFMSLRALGISNDQMRIIIVQDLNLGGIIHAIVLFFIDGQPYVLDNQIPQVTPAANIYHYKPIYSINETHWWKHIPIQ